MSHENRPIRLTNLSRVLILASILSYVAMGAGVTKLPFLLAAGTTGALMTAVVLSRTAERLFFDRVSTNANHKLATFALGAVLLFGVFGLAALDVPSTW